MTKDTLDIFNQKATGKTASDYADQNIDQRQMMVDLLLIAGAKNSTTPEEKTPLDYAEEELAKAIEIKAILTAAKKGANPGL